MSSIFSGGPQSESKRPTYTRPAGDYLAGKLPYGFTDPSQLSGLPGFFGDMGGQSMYPFASLYGGMQNLPGQSQQAGADLRQLASMGAQQGFGNTMGLAGMAPGLAQQQLQMAGYAPNVLGASAGYGQMLNGIIGQGAGSGVGIPGGNLARVTDAALNQANNVGVNGDIYQRTMALLRPQVRSAFADRGLGTSGQAIQGEGDQAQQLADTMAQQAYANRNAFLGTAASAGSAEGNERVGLTNAAVNQALGLGGLNMQRGNLALQGMTAAPNAWNSILGGQNQAFQGLGMAGQQQFQPLQLAGLGGGVYGQGLNMPLDFANQMYGATRAPFFQMGNWANGVPNVATSGQKEGFLGIG